ncbi:phage Gp19/Gp15/Gp42 family protein [Enterococcus lactis]|uniref:phage Gp19/Gp15/Gp42 family protein n=1 Tax=Enterococcus TaxID=1350 RepID=UPI000353308E|nr:MULTISPECIES: phage Gp19/Gp15/Gp42 family protein [Enterococcus]NWJ14217.1 phage Gp19/Gp15/Gp42 family protein [Clostridium perfringens]EJC3744163.1 phage Gp19/Gp15/Gp42 family protein [Enterococcus faecium]EME8128170.1 phage Gp19/Gp15/Gp42 family protein [Enterococcus faecium]EME8164944.1 phage Gp19/Gp15/Gp42 family protein [Enterococcus faecium]EMF0296995.1 phage Gp19/Gp15/Gp42 family protein [Enterococcus hirae]
MQPFATIEDLENLWRKLKPDETERAKQLLIIVSDSLREEAGRVGKDLDKMINEKPPYFTNVVKSVTVDIVARTLMTSTDQEPMTQTTESALGYSWSGSYLVPGGGLFIKNTELSRLGLRRQRYGVIDFYGQD